MVKRVPCSNIIQANSALSEARVLLSLNHPHIVKYSNFFLEQARPGAGIACFVCTVMEYCPGGDLERLLGTLGRIPMPEEQLLVIARSVCFALHHLQQNSIIHRSVFSLLKWCSSREIFQKRLEARKCFCWSRRRSKDWRSRSGAVTVSPDRPDTVCAGYSTLHGTRGEANFLSFFNFFAGDDGNTLQFSSGHVVIGSDAF